MCARSSLTPQIVTFTVGKEGRLFAAHEDVLSLSPFFAALCRGQFLEAQSKRIDLPDEEPEIFSCVLEYLYVRISSSHPARYYSCASANISSAEGRLLPPLGPQQAQKLLGTRRCREEPKPRKHRWPRIRRGYNIHLQRGRTPFEGHRHILCRREVRPGGAQAPCSSEAGSAEWNRGRYYSP